MPSCCAIGPACENWPHLPPTNNLIGIWAIADRVDIFANGQFQYEINTKTSNGGGFGLGFSTTGAGLSSLNFSQLGIFEP